MALRTTLARLAQPLRAQSAAFSAIPTPRPKYTERQEKLGRPMSPHVTTYAFPAVAISSITQRVKAPNAPGVVDVAGDSA